MNTTNAVIDNVEKIRVAKRFSKTQVARELKLSLQGYRHIVNGEVKLDVERLRIISNFLKVPIYIFFDDRLTDSVINDLKKTA